MSSPPNPSSPTSTKTPTRPLSDFDPQKPFIGSDGLEYADVAAKILGEPIENWRNGNVCRIRAIYGPEAARRWVSKFDGGDPRPTVSLPLSEFQIRYHRDKRGDFGF